MINENIVPTVISPFDAILRLDQDVEYWLARELMPLLGYPRWSDFVQAVERAKVACENVKNSVTENFSGLLLKTKGRPKEDYRLSRYACYLVAMNGDPRKVEIAQAQTYFAIKTREAEIKQAGLPKSPAEIILAQAQQLVDHEQRIKSIEREVQEIKQRSINATEELHQLPPPTEPAPLMTERANLRQLINKWCDATNVDQHLAWTKLYTELYYRDGFSVNARMKKEKYATKLDLIVDCGKLSVLQDIFGSGKGTSNA
jgi:BRO family, N-terminal domain